VKDWKKYWLQHKKGKMLRCLPLGEPLVLLQQNVSDFRQKKL